MGQFKLVGNGYLEQCFRRDTEVVPDPEETNFSNVCHEHQKNGSICGRAPSLRRFMYLENIKATEKDFFKPYRFNYFFKIRDI